MRTLGKWIGRFLLLVVLAIAAFLIFAPGYVEKSRNAVAPHDPFEISGEAKSLHESLTVGDWHADTLLWKRDPLKRASRGQVDLPRLKEGNVAVQVFTAVTKSPSGQNYEENSADAQDNITLLAIGQLWPVATWDSLYERALFQAERLHTAAADSDGQLRVITSRTELDQLLADRAAGQEVTGGLLGVEGAHPLEGDFAKLQGLQDAGYRVIGLQHFFDNELGGSLHGTGDVGLTDFGREVVAAIEERDLVLDVAHSSPQVVRDVLALTNMPIIVSHTGIHSNCPVKRNFQDDMMRDIAATGGVIGIGYWADVTCNDSPLGVAKTIRAAVDVVGEDHVSLGSDFDGSVATGFDTAELAAVTQALIAQDLTDGQIRKVMGDNMIRVLRERLK